MPTVSYGLKITNENRIFDHTIRIYRDAVRYLMDIVSLHYEEISGIEASNGATAGQRRQGFVEKLVHGTEKRPAVYKTFDQRFYKFPSYLRRDAITDAIGKIMSYRSQVENWEKGGKKGRRPFLKRSQDVMPCFYKDNMYRQDGEQAELKLYNGKDWVWHTVKIRSVDFRYALAHVSGWKSAVPVLARRGHRYELRIAYTAPGRNFPKYTKDKDVSAVLGVDLGLNTDAVCSVIRKDGTVTGQKFLNSPVEKDRMYGLLNAVKKAQQHGSRKNRRLWRFINNYNGTIAVKTASAIVDFARESQAQVIVMEYLHFSGKKRGSKKQRLAMWRKKEIQRRVEALASRCGIRVSYVCAVNTSRLAYDGSGKVVRGKDAGFPSNELCRFQTGKVYNCDLSASKNIGARYFLRTLIKSVPAKGWLPLLAEVPEAGRRTTCTLDTLIRVCAALCTLKVSGWEAPGCAASQGC